MRLSMRLRATLRRFMGYVAVLWVAAAAAGLYMRRPRKFEQVHGHPCSEGDQYVALLIAGVARSLPLLSTSIVENLVHAQERTTGVCQVDTFLLLIDVGNGDPLLADNGRVYRESLERAGANVVDSYVHSVKTEEVRDIAMNRRTEIKTHERSNMAKVASQNYMIYMKLLRADAYEKKNKIRYDWFIHSRTDSYWFGPPPAVSTLDQNTLYVPNFGQYGGINDRFAMVPRSQRYSFFGHRYTKWKNDTVTWRCRPLCPWLWVDWWREPNHEHNNECLLHSVLLQAKTPFAEIQFDFTIAKDYAGDGKLCAVYYNECAQLGQHECRCWSNRCKNLHSKKFLADVKKLAVQESAITVGKAPKPVKRRREAFSWSLVDFDHFIRRASREWGTDQKKCDSSLQDE